MAYGMAREEALAHARLGVAISRGLLLDLLATGNREAVDAAMEAYIDLMEARLAAQPGQFLRIRTRFGGSLGSGSSWRSPRWRPSRCPLRHAPDEPPRTRRCCSASAGR